MAEFNFIFNKNKDLSVSIRIYINYYQCSIQVNDKLIVKLSSTRHMQSTTHSAYRICTHPHFHVNLHIMFGNGSMKLHLANVYRVMMHAWYFYLLLFPVYIRPGALATAADTVISDYVA